MNRFIVLLPVLFVGLSSGCRCSRDKVTPPTVPAAAASDSGPNAGASASASASAPSDEAVGTTVTVVNLTDANSTAFVAFGADSVIVSSSWSAFCTASSPLSCSFPIRAHSRHQVPVGGKYLNATFSFGTAVTCGTTKAEVNVNNPNWFDIADVSLVDGFSNFVMVEANGTKLGPPHGKDQNEKVFGVYPLGCDLCTANSVGTCGLPKGKTGCKGGTQYKPDVPCQYQGPKKGGGGKVDVILLQPVPA
jgi:hypothetical protein